MLFQGQEDTMSSWITDLAGKAEHLLNKIDQNAADAAASLSTKSEIRRSSNTSEELSALQELKQEDSNTLTSPSPTLSAQSDPEHVSFSHKKSSPPFFLLLLEKRVIMYI